MSAEITLWAARQDITNHGAKLVLMALGDAYDDRTGQCFPSLQTLADYVRRSPTQIKTAIRWLKANGWIKAEARHGANGRQTSNSYEILFEKGESFDAMLARRKQMRGGRKPDEGGGGKQPGGEAENSPLEGAGNSPPLTNPIERRSAQARKGDKSVLKEDKRRPQKPFITPSRLVLPNLPAYREPEPDERRRVGEAMAQQLAALRANLPNVRDSSRASQVLNR